MGRLTSSLKNDQYESSWKLILKSKKKKKLDFLFQISFLPVPFQNDFLSRISNEKTCETYFGQDIFFLSIFIPLPELLILRIIIWKTENLESFIETCRNFRLPNLGGSAASIVAVSGHRAHQQVARCARRTHRWEVDCHQELGLLAWWFWGRKRG